MDGRFNDNPLPSEPEIAPGSTTDLKTAQASLLKRSRRSVQKRVVSVPIADSSDGSRPRGAGEIAPPSDSWAWRKYGQKPIKGSPYPRGYYRCSSSKGCPARKQVERSHVDPNMLVVTYACEHNHHHSSSTPKPPPEEHAAPIRPDSDDKFADLVGDESAILMMPDDICWPSSTSPPAATEELLYTPFCSVEADAAMLCASEGEKLGGREGEEDEEDSLFADLGELPEYSVVFRRGYLERQMRIQVQGEEIRGYNLTATSTG